MHKGALQGFDTITPLPIALDASVCQQSVTALNQILADTICLRDLYKKHHWQVAGPTFYQMHLLFDKHYEEQNKLVDEIAERVQLLGGVSVAAAGDVEQLSQIPAPPKEREHLTTQITRLLKAHETVLRQTRQAAKQADEAGDDGTNDLLVSDVIRTNELQVWFVSQHLVDVPLIEQDGK